MLTAGDDRLHLLQRLRNLREILRSGPLRGFRGDLALNEDARVEQLDGAGAGVDRRRRWRVAATNVGAGSGADLDQPGDLEGNHGFAHSGPADAKLLREKLLGRQPRARRHRAALDLLANAVRDLLVKPLVDDGFKHHAPYAATARFADDRDPAEAVPETGSSGDERDPFLVAFGVRFVSRKGRSGDVLGTFRGAIGNKVNDIPRS